MTGTIIGSSHTGIQVRNLERSLEFYVDLLGFTLRQRREIPAPSYVGTIVGYPDVEQHQAYLNIPGSDHHWLELIEYRGIERGESDPATGNVATMHICLLVDDLQAIYERLLAADVKFVSPPVTPTSGPNIGGKVLYMLDPDGIRVELVQTSSTTF